MVGLMNPYRRSGDYLIADGLAPAWRLRAGEAPQQIVTVARGKAIDPAALALGGQVEHGMNKEPSAGRSDRASSRRRSRRKLRDGEHQHTGVWPNR